MKLQFIRHATLWLEYKGKQILIDPMFSEKEINPPIPNSPNGYRNPMVSLPVHPDELSEPDFILLSHLHMDHWDSAAISLLPKSTPILCQPGDDPMIAASGFQRVEAVYSSVTYEGITVHLTGGQHGTGDIGRAMGQVSGFILQADGEPTLYIAGDTIYCEEVADAMTTYRPDFVVVNAGGARFNVGDSITMTPEHVKSVCADAPNAIVIAVHMDTINHCLVSRENLRSALAGTPCVDRVLIPEDGQWC
ncbi:MBL fold metallo-hydrolase [Cohnella mopanensis]|uniref:MBL fold metallo-hydrolase n=1 Tax=Cohnella mopanensis TaxID=2911966 RepID=UPI001EF893D0|nr:MBL fold metallo-hydrolase [Cohnella mopanensis]